MDLTANVKSSVNIDPGKKEIMPTGIAISVPKDLKFK